MVVVTVHASVSVTITPTVVVPVSITPASPVVVDGDEDAPRQMQTDEREQDRRDDVSPSWHG